MTKTTLLASVAFTIAKGFENDGGGWKMDGDKMALADGNPVWIDGDGTERTIKRETIPNLQNENKTYRTQLEELRNKSKDFEGLDPKEARAALEKLKNVDLSQMVEAGKLDEVKETLKTEYTGQITERDQTIAQLNDRINGMMLDSAFGGSEYIRDNIAVPVEMFRAAFGQYFKIEDGKITAQDRAGNRIMSKKNIGEYADFDEAIELLVEGYSQRDAILKAPEHRGAGSSGGGGGRGGARVIKRSDLEGLPPQKVAELMAKVRSGEMQLQ